MVTFSATVSYQDPDGSVSKGKIKGLMSHAKAVGLALMISCGTVGYVTNLMVSVLSQ